MKTGIVTLVAAVVIATALGSALAALADDPESLIAPVCSADLDADGIVAQADLDRLLRSYGACKGCGEDLNWDDFVDDNDVAIMIKQWGPCRPEGDIFGGDQSGGDADSLDGPDKNRTTTARAAPRCKGDLNGDSSVDEKDMARVLRHYGTCAACEEDLNKDGLVDDDDAQIIDQQWGPCRPEGDIFGGGPGSDGLIGGTDSLSKKKDTPEDVNDDGVVDMIDILIVVKHMGQEPTGDNAFSDVNEDRKIDKYDIKAIADYVISG